MRITETWRSIILVLLLLLGLLFTHWVQNQSEDTLTSYNSRNSPKYQDLSSLSSHNIVERFSVVE